MAEVAGSQTKLAADVEALNSKIMINDAAYGVTYRNVWFSDSADDLKRVHDTDFQYNPGTNDLKVGTINGKTVKDITIKNYEVALDAWSAGTIGTRASQKSLNLASDVSTYGTILSFSLVYIADSSAAHCQTFLTSGNSTLYVNAYRATAAAYSAASTFAVTVRVVYAK